MLSIQSTFSCFSDAPSDMKCTLFFLVKLGAVLSEIVLVPSNIAVMAGEKMDMNCLTTNRTEVLIWTIYSSNRTTSTILHGSLRGHFAHFGVEINANGPVIISANSTRSSDAGIYTCLCEIDGKDAEYSAHLIVLDSLPTCESNLTRNYSYSLIDDDEIWIQCNVNFRGFWAPSMKWTQHSLDFGTEGKTITDGIETMHSPSQNVTSKLIIAVNSSTNGFYYSCRIYFANYSGKEVTTAKNVPNFTYTWNSSVIYVTHFSTQSVGAGAATDAGTSLAVTSSTTETTSSLDWYLISLSLVAGMSLFLILMAALTIALCIRFKKKASDHKASATKETIEMPTQESAYDIIPDATSDNYETIGEEDTDPSVILSSRPRLGLLPTPGYEGLMPVQPSPPTIYSRLGSYETPVDTVPDLTLTKVIVAIEVIPEKLDELETGKTESPHKESLINVPTYLEVKE